MGSATLAAPALAIVYLCFACVQGEEVSSFLRSGVVSTQDAERSLAHEFAVSDDRLKGFMDELQPTFTALPKNAEGRLGHQAVRYVLHRFFVARHGWYVKGLEPNGDTWHTQTANNGSVSEWVPSFLLESLEHRLGTRGINLHDLAALAAALEDLVTEEAHGRLASVYEATGLSNVGNRSQAEYALTTYLIVYLVGGNFTYKDKAEIDLKERYFANKYKGWEAVQLWLRGVELDEFGARSSKQDFDFSQVMNVANKVGAHFGSFNDKECQDLKSTLLEKVGRSRKAGRVRLADFYRIGLYSHWGLSEKPEFLEAIGALDKSNASNPLVIIPNYLSSRPNCLEVSGLYAVCCRNECEDLLGSLERDIAAPHATPERIAQLVEQLTSPTTSPRQLTQSQRSKLDEIALLHGGQVNLHGRLFAQWLHHAFPNECPYPHEAGTTSPVSANEWVGEESQTEEELKSFVEQDTCRGDGKDVDAAELADLPWSDKEELLTPLNLDKAMPHKKPKRFVLFAMLSMVFLLMVSSSHPVPQRLRGLDSTLTRHGVRWQLVVVGVLAVLALISGVLDTSVFALAVVGSLLALLARKMAPADKLGDKLPL